MSDRLDLSPGTQIGGYEIIDVLGAGGMGEVYRAHDKRLGRDVALKVVNGAIATDPDRTERFEREARAASALNHPSIVHIYDIGAQESVQYIAMELVSGQTLRRHLAAGKLPLGEALRLATQLAEGLAKAHAAHIVHRDLKPENLMLTNDGFLKILDFGLAKLIAPEPTGTVDDLETIAPMSTRPGMLLGTVEYMSPEQARGLPVDHRADQFAFGTILYEMVTGRLAFRRDTAVQTLASIIEHEPPPATSLAIDLPASLGDIIGRCLAKDPAERFATTTELVTALKRASVSDPVAARPAPARPVDVARQVDVAPARTAEVLESQRPRAVDDTRGDYFVRHGGKVRVVGESRMRRRLRSGHYSGTEMARHESQDGWQMLAELPIYRQEVGIPSGKHPFVHAHERKIKGFFGHLVSFVMVGLMFTWQLGIFPHWMGWWLFGLGWHAFGTLPSVFALIRYRKQDQLKDASPQPLAAPAPEPAPPKAMPAPRISDSLAAEVGRVRELLAARKEGQQQVADVDRIVATIEQLTIKEADLAEQCTPRERAKLQTALAEAEGKLEAADSDQDRRLLERHIQVLRQRLATIDKANRVRDRLQMRIDLAQHQLKQLRLDLTRAEAANFEPLELTSRLRDIRHEVDAIEEVEELLGDL